MAFRVILYRFNKRDNSTKQPTSAGATYSCVLKAGCSIMHPEISLDIGVTSDPAIYNYAYIEEWGRYYFIEDWYFDRSLWTASLKVDVLATYKTVIGNSSLYVIRAAAANDGSITDTLYPAKTGCTYAHDTISNQWISDYCYVVGVISEAGRFGSMTYYATTPAHLTTLCQFLLDNTVTNDNGFDWDDCSQALQLSLVDPLQYIKSCICLPIPVSEVTGDVGMIKVFNWQTLITAKQLTAAMPYISKTFTFTIPKHPLTSKRGNYVNSAPFTSLSLTIPPFGTFDIDTSITCNASTLDAVVIMDPITGKATLSISCHGSIINRIESQLGVPISLSSVTRDYIGAAQSAAGAIGGAISGFGAMGAAGAALGAVNGIGNAVNAMMPRASTIGTTGSFGTLRGDFKLDAQFFTPIADDNTHNGRPLCQMKTINTLSGYMIIQDGDVSTSGTSAEDTAIRNYLEGGFYYE